MLIAAFLILLGSAYVLRMIHENKCPHCKKYMPRDASVCAACGRDKIQPI